MTEISIKTSIPSLHHQNMTTTNTTNGLLTPPLTPTPLEENNLYNIPFLFNHDTPQIANLKQKFATKFSQKLTEIEEEYTSNKYRWREVENDRNWNGQRMYLSRWDGKERDYPYSHPINDPLFGFLHTAKFRVWIDDLTEISMAFDYGCEWRPLCCLRHRGGHDSGIGCIGYVDGVVEKKVDRILEILGEMEKCLDGILEQEIKIGDRLVGVVGKESWKWKDHYQMVWDIVNTPPDEDKICNGCEGACCVAAALKP